MKKEERIARRKANKDKRQARKADRKGKFSELMTKVKETPDLPDDVAAPDYVDKFKTYWPVVRAGLEFAESTKITRPKMDLGIQRVIELGNGMAENPVFDPGSEFIQKIQKAWRIIRTILIAITIFITDDENDDKIDKLIEIGDWISDLDGDE